MLVTSSTLTPVAYKGYFYKSCVSLFQVVAPINKLLETVPFDLVCYSLDWHPSDHISFIDNVHNRKLDISSPVKV